MTSQIIPSRLASINLKGRQIISDQSLKLLGVDGDSNLNFNNHVNNVCKKASHSVGVNMKLRNLFPTTAKLVLFKRLLSYFISSTAI